MPTWAAYARNGSVLGHVEAGNSDLARRKADARWPQQVAVLVETKPPPRRPRDRPRATGRPRSGNGDRGGWPRPR